jgi:hypothetical protein
MKVPYDEGVASHIGPASCAGDRKGAGEALTGESAGRVLSRERGLCFGVPTVSIIAEGNTRRSDKEGRLGPAWSKTLRTHGSFLHGNREIPQPPLGDGLKGRAVNPEGARW